MVEDVTPVILITDGKDGSEFRIAIAEGWKNAWSQSSTGEGVKLHAAYVLSVFANAKVLTTIDDARRALQEFITAKGYSIGRDQVSMDLRFDRRSVTLLEKLMCGVKVYTFEDLIREAASDMTS